MEGYVIACFFVALFWVGIVTYKLKTDDLTIGSRRHRWHLEDSFDYDTARKVLLWFGIIMTTIWVGMGLFLILY